jgi:hypothetical protein
MGSQPPSHRKSSHSTARTLEPKHVKHEVEPLDPHSTEYIVSQLIDPSVPENEVIEYEG